jgi:hypothetical protein
VILRAPRVLSQALYETLEGAEPLFPCVDAAAGELARAQAALGTLPRDTLVLADRLSGNGVWFATLAAQGCWGLVRQNRRLGLRKRQRLARRPVQGGWLTDWLVDAGGSRSIPPQRLRHIRWQRGATVRAVLTNVLDPARLSAAEALALYPCRWRVERLFFDLKEVLNLHRVDAGNPNAIAMQVYAAGCVYNAMRVAQGEVAEAGGIPPEAISPAKFFPKMAAACHCAALFALWFLDTQAANRGWRLRKPPVQQRRFGRVQLDAILVELRTLPRRKRRFCKTRRKWKSLSHVRGGRRLLKLS